MSQYFISFHRQIIFHRKTYGLFILSSVHSSAKGHFGHFYFLDIMIHVAMNIHVQLLGDFVGAGTF